MIDIPLGAPTRSIIPSPIPQHAPREESPASSQTPNGVTHTFLPTGVIVDPQPCVIVMTFWYIFGTDLSCFKLFKLLFSFGIDHDPHVLYVHMTYVYSFSHVPFFTRSHGQGKSLSYYDLFDFGVLFYGRLPTLIFFYFPHNPTTPILPV